ncbi:CBS domain-containing protein [Telluribacter sp. SYSU D00476]|uniref:CBS domain-containing protein n=1 Tax=Telluribacter sp. SYSU D00476 TaxID=2811430 RepID=UPI001FF54FD6|nr:CBS domain-containing protein [Telluribacter sp. SYSU D00476]
MISVKKLLYDKPTSGVWSVTPATTVIDTLYFMSDKNIGAVVVLDGEELVGIFSERDYARKGIVQGRKASSTPISEVMTSPVFTVSSDMGIQECMKLFSEKKIRHLPVVDQGRVVGVLSIGDIVNSIMSEQRQHIQFLEHYITNA